MRLLGGNAIMKAETIRPAELDRGLIETWRAIQKSNPTLRSPFFAPEFAIAIGAARADARVAILSDAGQTIGFLPHHLVAPGLAKPIGGQICDYQGLICAEDAEIDAQALLAAAGLKAYDFNHAPQAMRALASGAFDSAGSPFMDLAGGFDAYLKRLDKPGKHSVKETERRIRKMTREIGPVRFHRNERTEAAWAGLLAMKNASFERKGSKSVLDLPWVAAALEQLRAIDTPEFAGLLSTVYAGDRLVAAHFGMRAAGAWNWWFNTYDFELKNLAPGLINILEAAKIAENEGVEIIDFGRGDQYYKKAFATGETIVCEGSIERSAAAAGVLRQAQRFALKATGRMENQRWRHLAKRAARKLVGGSVHLPN